MNWIIYYSDGSTATSKRFSPFSLDRRVGVQVIAMTDKDHRWITRSGADFYVWDDRGGGSRWFGATRSGLDQYLMLPGLKCVLFGFEIDKKKFNEIFYRARDEFGNKEVFDTEEMHP